MSNPDRTTLIETCRAATARLGSQREALEFEIGQRAEKLVQRLPLESVHRVLVQPATMERYSLSASTIAEVDGQLRVPEVSAETRSAVLRWILIALIESMPQRLAREPLPRSVETLQSQNVLRIERGLNTLPKEAFDLQRDFFLKDLALLCLRLLPCGAELVQVMAGVPRSLLLRGGISQLARGLAFFANNVGGFHPFLSLHMDTRQLEDFTPQGWDRSYLRMADLLEARPALKGVFGTAWFYDPAMEEISPHLAYLRRSRLEAGAAGFVFGPTESARNNALARSNRRRALSEAGKYTPISYYVIWPREALIAWARSHRPSTWPNMI